MAKPYRIALAEDHTILREGLKAIISAQADMEVVCEATDGREAIRCAETHAPDLLVLDLSMPRMNGLDAVKEIRRCCSATKVLVLTVHKTEEYVFSALQAGADGYVLKEATSAELLVAVRSVLQGHRYLSPEVSTRVIEGYLDGRDPHTFQSSLDELSDREREVLKLIAEGYRNKEIADFLCIAVKTVEKHRSNLMRKLDLHTVSAITAFAIEKGVVQKA